jgi:diguanylate cyclase (GGDEF)-like protein
MELNNLHSNLTLFGWRKLWGIIVLSAVFYAAAWVGLKMAIEPGFASPVWPAAGIALAALLLYGKHLWPGILIGSFFINLPGSIDAGSGMSIIQSMVVPASIGLGSSLQALVGYWLIRRYVDLGAGLLDARSVVLFLGLGAPVSSLVSASWGVVTLSLSGIIETSDLAYSWITWWSGDCLGVLFMLPLIFIWLAEPREIWASRKTRVAMPLMITIGTVVIIFFVASQQQQQQLKTNFRAQGKMLGDALEKKVTQNFELIFSLQNMFEISSSVQREQFKQYAMRALSRNPSIHALSWNPRITNADRNIFEELTRAEGFPSFVISERDISGNIVKAGAREDYFVAHFIEPFSTNEKVLGYDIYSDPARKLAVDSAHARHEITATRPITLVQETGEQTGVLFLLPVYFSERQTGETTDSSQLADGLVVGVFRAGDLLLEGLGATQLHNVNLRMTDVTEPSNPDWLAGYQVIDGMIHSEVYSTPFAGQQMHWRETLQLGGRSWLVEVLAPTAYLRANRSWTAWGILLVGLLFSSLLGGFLLILSGQDLRDRNRSDELAAEIVEREKIEAELHQVNQALQEIASTDVLTGIANRRATEDFAVKLDAEVQRFRINYAVLMLDIDHFKAVNDRWGHEVGDRVLQKFSKTVELALRNVDFFGRWGGEEFIILSKNTTLQDGICFAERLCNSIATTDFNLDGPVTTSIGVAAHCAGESYVETIINADRALYKAKNSGRNCVGFIEDTACEDQLVQKKS